MSNIPCFKFSVWKNNIFVIFINLTYFMLQIDSSDISSDDGRQRIYDQLLSSCVELSHFERINKLLQVWPMLESVQKKWGILTWMYINYLHGIVYYALCDKLFFLWKSECISLNLHVIWELISLLTQFAKALLQMITKHIKLTYKLSQSTFSIKDYMTD